MITVITTSLKPDEFIRRMKVGEPIPLGLRDVDGLSDVIGKNDIVGVYYMKEETVINYALVKDICRRIQSRLGLSVKLCPP